MPNREAREIAIQAVIDSYIGTDGQEIGMLIVEPSWTDLELDVTGLRQYGRSPKWQSAIDSWMDRIKVARSTFANENELSESVKYRDLTFTTSRQYARFFKWAVLQGGIDASYGA